MGRGRELVSGADEPGVRVTVVGLVIVFGPLVAERLRLPGLLGLLSFGAVIGPNMLEVLPRFAGPEAVGSIGVLYLIFLAGLQLDLDACVRYRPWRRSPPSPSP
jgi:Kef-type K+ transport system membrane component KefB